MQSNWPPRRATTSPSSSRAGSSSPRPSSARWPTSSTASINGGGRKSKKSRSAPISQTEKLLIFRRRTLFCASEISGEINTFILYVTYALQRLIKSSLQLLDYFGVRVWDLVRTTLAKIGFVGCRRGMEK